MPNEEPGIYRAGEVILKNVFLYDSKLNRTNLWTYFLEISIYEDLFSPCLSGHITIVETLNLIANIPILGDEILEIEYVTPTLSGDNVIHKQFSITKIDPRTYGGDKKNVYLIHFISREAVIDLDTRMSRAYSGNAAEIVERIFKQDIRSKEPLEVDSADNKIKFVSPFWSPLKCINYATSRCLAPNSSIIAPNYLFYQTTKKFKLKSLTNLFNQAPMIQYFFTKKSDRAYLEDKTSVPDINLQYQHVKELHFVASQDYIKNTLSGALSHQVNSVNLLNKEIGKKVYNIKRDFNKSTHLEKHPIYPINAPISNYGLMEHRVTMPQLFDGVGDKADDILSKRLALLGQLDLFKVDIVVAGRSDFEVGMVVDLTIPDFRELLPEEISKEIKDKYYSGKYLITSIQHRLTQSQHQMVLQLSKESTANMIKIGGV